VLKNYANKSQIFCCFVVLLIEKKIKSDNKFVCKLKYWKLNRDIKKSDNANWIIIPSKVLREKSQISKLLSLNFFAASKISTQNAYCWKQTLNSDLRCECV